MPRGIPKRGYRAPGAGRPKSDAPTKVISVRVPAEVADFWKERGAELREMLIARARQGR
jgi:hypothetical protein